MAALTTMKHRPLLHAARALALAAVLNACGKQEPKQTTTPTADTKPAAPAVAATPASEAKPKEEAKPKVEEKPKAAEATPAPAPTVDPLFATPATDLKGFGSDEPAPRADEPTRGVIHVDLKDVKRMSAQHWEQFDCTNFAAKRWGRYEIRVTYTLKHASLGTQFRFGQQGLKKTLMASGQPKSIIYGEVYIEQPGTYPFVLYIAATGAEAGFEMQDIAFVPAPEGPAPVQAADGSVVLEAKTATTWSENMRYEPKPEKNCLGFWTSEDDMAEWEFQAVKPGRYKVSVFQGCGTGNEGSEVAVKLGGQELKFTVKDTGGFQNWQEAQVGEIEIKDKGLQRLVIDPVTKTKSAVLDVQKVVLTPVS